MTLSRKNQVVAVVVAALVAMLPTPRALPTGHAIDHLSAKARANDTISGGHSKTGYMHDKHTEHSESPAMKPAGYTVASVGGDDNHEREEVKSDSIKDSGEQHAGLTQSDKKTKSGVYNMTATDSSSRHGEDQEQGTHPKKSTAPSGIDSEPEETFSDDSATDPGNNKTVISSSSVVKSDNNTTVVKSSPLTSSKNDSAVDFSTTVDACFGPRTEEVCFGVVRLSPISVAYHMVFPHDRWVYAAVGNGTHEESSHSRFWVVYHIEDRVYISERHASASGVPQPISIDLIVLKNEIDTDGLVVAQWIKDSAKGASDGSKAIGEYTDGLGSPGVQKFTWALGSDEVDGEDDKAALPMHDKCGSFEATLTKGDTSGKNKTSTTSSGPGDNSDDNDEGESGVKVLPLSKAVSTSGSLAPLMLMVLYPFII